MSNVAHRVDRLEGHRRGTADRAVIAGLAERYGIDVASIEAEVARILGRAEAAGHWSADEEVALIAAESGRPVAEVRARYAGILAEAGR